MQCYMNTWFWDINLIRNSYYKCCIIYDTNRYFNNFAIGPILVTNESKESDIHLEKEKQNTCRRQLNLAL